MDYTHEHIFKKIFELCSKAVVIFDHSFLKLRSEEQNDRIPLEINIMNERHLTKFWQKIRLVYSTSFTMPEIQYVLFLYMISRREKS